MLHIPLEVIAMDEQELSALAVKRSPTPPPCSALDPVPLQKLPLYLVCHCPSAPLETPTVAGLNHCRHRHHARDREIFFFETNSSSADGTHANTNTRIVVARVPPALLLTVS